MKKKKIFILFMSHRSGEHGLSIHNSMKELKEELKSVIEVIHDEGLNKKAKKEDMKKVNEVCDGYWAELSDSTWFDVFEREV